MNGYRRGAVIFHWSAAALLTAAGALGVLHEIWPKRIQSLWIDVHAVIGVALWLLVVAGLIRRMGRVPPAPAAGVGLVYHRLSRTLHAAIYLLLWLTPIVGMVNFAASDRGIFEPAELAHAYLSYALFTLITAHVLAVLWLQFVRRDRILQRMWHRC